MAEPNMEATLEERLAQLEAQQAELAEERDALRANVDSLTELKGRMGRELGEVRQKLSQLNTAPPSSQMTAKEKVDKFVNNPDEFISSAFNQNSKILLDKIERLENDIGYFATAEQHPEWRNAEFRKEVLAKQLKERENGREVGIVDCIHSVKFEKKEAELIEKEKKYQESVAELEKEKAGITSFRPGSASLSTRKQSTEPDEFDKLIGGKKSDGAPF